VIGTAQAGRDYFKKDLGLNPVLHARQKKLTEHEKTLECDDPAAGEWLTRRLSPAMALD
jgi:hypothetical protein